MPAWDHLSINKPHLAYIILGGFTSIFMLVSLFVKEKLYIGEATVATICGIIFGPHAADLFNPNTWGNVDQITLEASRIVLVVQCFAVGVELPKAYMTRHWKSVVFLLVPVMTFGWLVTSVFIWGLIRPLNWLDSLCVAACVTATDPVLASSVVGKGKFAKRIPKHLRDLLSAESGCNDGMAFPFIYLSLYLIRYRPHGGEVFYHWFVLTILYECIFGAFFGCCVGYAGRRLIRWAEEKQLIDRESFLVFYFTLALFCAGAGSILGVDDLLVGFCAGVAFSNDGWFSQKTEESHVSNVIDLLLNLAYFVYFGSIIPWAQYNRPDWGLEPWRLVCIALLVIFFRRIPIMVMLKPFIPDIKTWREAFFAGHFGPIGVGAIFVAILARAELENEDTTPLAVLPSNEDFPHLLLIELIWPITTFLVIASIIVHGSSVAVFTLGKRLNHMTLTMSYTTQGAEDSWVNRLPFISRGQSLSFSKKEGDNSSNEKLDGEDQVPPGQLPPPGGFKGSKHKKGKSSGHHHDAGSVGRRRNGLGRPKNKAAGKDDEPRTPSEAHIRDTLQLRPSDQVYEEGNDIIVENYDGEVINQLRSNEDGEMEENYDESKDTRAGHPGSEAPHFLQRLEKMVSPNSGQVKSKTVTEPISKPANLGAHRGGGRSGSYSKPPPTRRHGTATAYQSGNNVIVEDEDGEVIKVIRTNTATRRPSLAGPSGSGMASARRPSLQRVGTWFSGAWAPSNNTTGDPEAISTASNMSDDGHGIHLHNPLSGRRMSRHDVVEHLKGVDPKHRKGIAKAHDIPEGVLEEVKAEEAAEKEDREAEEVGDSGTSSPNGEEVSGQAHVQGPKGKVIDAAIKSARSGHPSHALKQMDTNLSGGSEFDDETEVERRRRLNALGRDEDSDNSANEEKNESEEEETPAERRRRLAALGHSEEEPGDEEPSQARPMSSQQAQAGPSTPSGSSTPSEQPRRAGIRFAEQAKRSNA